MLFKSKKIQSQFKNLHWKLRYILFFLDNKSIKEFNKEIFITSLIRPKKKDSGIHALKRAGDIRTKNYYTKSQIETLVSFLKNTYIYDPKRPKYKIVLYHKVHGSTLHIHVQVHNRTIVKWWRNYL